MSLEYFTFGYKEFHEGALIRLEPFCEPHDEHMLDNVKEVLPLLVARACVVRCTVATLAVEISGDVRGGEDARTAVQKVAYEGALTLRAVDKIIEDLRMNLTGEATKLVSNLGLAERIELTKGLADPNRPRAITLAEDVPFRAYAKTRAKDTVDGILAAAFSNSPDFPRA